MNESPKNDTPDSPSVDGHGVSAVDTSDAPGADTAGGRRRSVVVALVAAVVAVAAGLGLWFALRGDDATAEPGASGTPPQATSDPSSDPPPSSLPVAAPTGQDVPSTAAPVPPSLPVDAPAEAKSAFDVATSAVAAINKRDVVLMKSISCDPEAVTSVDTVPPDAKVELVGQPVISGDMATVEVKVAIGEMTNNIPLPLTRRGSSWCVG